MHDEFARSARIESVFAGLRAQGLDPVWVDRAPVFDKTTLMHALYQALQLPGWFGFNWDALADALRDLADEDGPPRVLVFDNFARLEAEDPESAATFIDILGSVTSEHGALRGMVHVDRVAPRE